MKISTINLSGIYAKQYNKTVFKHESQENFKCNQTPDEQTENRNIKKITFNDIEAYLIPSGDDRVYTSSNPELIEVPSKFKVNAFDNVPCPACGKKLLPADKYNEFLNKLDETENENYLSLLDEYKDYMRPVEYSVFEELTALSKDLGIKDIQTLLCQLRNTKLPLLEHVQLKKIKEIEYIAKKLPEEESRALLSKVVEFKKIIKKNNAESPFRRKVLIDKISRVHISNQDKYNKVLELVKSFPTSSDMNSAWIVKYSGKDKNGQDWKSKDIARRMLEFSVPNTDHILARDIELNHDDISNYMAMHTSCNGQKANKPLMQWIHENKTERIKNLSAYFAKVDELISSKQIDDPRYKDYVENATKLISDISKGKIIVQVPKNNQNND